MPEKKRPAFTARPLPSEVVCTNASSTDTVSSGCSAMLAAPRHHGSMLAAKPSSDSARLKPRVPGPISASAGSRQPLSGEDAGSLEVGGDRAARLPAVAGVNDIEEPPEGAGGDA